ncbi:MAG: hypothetical protein PHN49_05195 [Candidatus Omnitrophica bacterium]|nr:hypothetical protein [Candidatus Omnitrophota bacterium]MDD5671016.1 hypothetical protein [Candidatus Omnitrophota bacterium]
MYCNFCGRNFETSEGFEEVKRQTDKLIRCEICVRDQVEEEYDWRNLAASRGSRGARSK